MHSAAREFTSFAAECSVQKVDNLLPLFARVPCFFRHCPAPTYEHIALWLAGQSSRQPCYLTDNITNEVKVLYFSHLERRNAWIPAYAGMTEKNQSFTAGLLKNYTEYPGFEARNQD
jgi:hypothetical protein